MTATALPASAARQLPGVRQMLLVLLLACVALLPTSWAQQLQPIPALTARVTDTSGTLSPADKASLEARLAAFEQNKGSQIVILMVPTTQPEDIAAYALRVAREWKVGRRDVGDGLLILVAKDDRRMRIEVSRALEGAVPDIAAAAIIDQAMKPRFAAGDYAGGLSAAVEQILARIDNEALPAPHPQGRTAPDMIDNSIGWIEALVIVTMVAMIGGALLKSILGRPLGSLATGAATGGIMFAMTGALTAAGIAGLVGLLIALFGGSGGGGRGGGGGGGSGPSEALRRRNNAGRRGPVILPMPGPGWGGGGGFGGGGFGGGFGSGGGGSFGGGGASGDW